MRIRSSRFDDAVKGKIRATYVTRVDAYRGGALKLANVPVQSGTVTLDLSAPSRRSVALEVIDDTGLLTPRLPTDPLNCFGSELVVSCGWDYHDGTTELLPQGVFRITRSVPTQARTIEISGLDRSEPVAAALHERPFVIAGGTNLGVAVRNLIESRLAGLTYDFVGTASTVPLTVYQEGDTNGDPWQNAMDLAAADGKELFFGANGEVVMRLRPDPSQAAPVWDYSPGPDSIRLGVANAHEITGVHNVWVAIAEGTGAALGSASAEVTDLTSPIHPGVIGRRPKFLRSQAITSAAQTQAAADGMKRADAGASERATFSAVPHPAHEPGDVVRLVDPSLGLDASVVLAAWTLDLRFGQASTFTTLGRRSA